MFWLYTKVVDGFWLFCQEFNTVDQAVSHGEQLLLQDKIVRYFVQVNR